MKGKNKKNKKRLIILVTIIVAAATLGFLSFTQFHGEKKKAAYVFTTIKKGSIENTVSSSGTLETLGTVSVRAQMSGTVEKIYADFNDKVTKNQPLLDLNTELLKIQEKEAEAAVQKANATYELKKLGYENNTKLFNKKLISDYDFQTSKTNMGIARADLVSAQAKLKTIQLELNQYALVVSPITGIVLARNVDVGDSVVSGNNSTNMFTLAENLSKMEIEASVDELDINQIKDNQKVRFTVDAYPDDTFYGVVRQIRLVPSTSSNIVSYTVIVDADNKDGKLMPGMTASLEFIIDEKKDVLLVPSAAFRFQPTGTDAAAAQKKLFEARIAQLPKEQQQQARERYEKMQKAKDSNSGQSSSGGLLSGNIRMPGMGRPPEDKKNSGKNGSAVSASAGNETKKALWYLDKNGELSVRYVKTGVSDDTNTEIITDADLAGKQVILKVKAE